MPADLELANGYYSAPVGASELQVLTGTPGTYTLNLPAFETNYYLWENGTEEIAKGDKMIGLNFGESSLRTAETAICSLGCDLIAWGEWYNDDSDLEGYWITADIAGSLDLITGDATYAGKAYGHHNGAELSGDFSADFDFSAMSLSYDITNFGSFEIDGTLTVYDVMFSGGDEDHTLRARLRQVVVG